MIPCQLIYKTESFSYNVVFLSMDSVMRNDSPASLSEFFVQQTPELLTLAEPLEQLF
jgi:hypothetical protein